MGQIATLQRLLREANASGDEYRAMDLRGRISNLKEQQVRHDYMMSLPPSGPAKDWEVFDGIEEVETFIVHATLVASEAGRMSGPRYRETYLQGNRELTVLRDQALNNQIIEFSFHSRRAQE